MAAIYSALLTIQNSQYIEISYIAIILEHAFYLQAALCVFAPAIAADWLSSQANTLKLMLHDQLIDGNGK